MSPGIYSVRIALLIIVILTLVMECRVLNTRILLYPHILGIEAINLRNKTLIFV